MSRSNKIPFVNPVPIPYANYKYFTWWTKLILHIVNQTTQHCKIIDASDYVLLVVKRML